MDRKQTSACENQINKQRAMKKEILEKWIKSIFPMTIDQKNVFVGQELTGERKVNGHSFYDLKVFYLIEPKLKEEELLAYENILHEKEYAIFEAQLPEIELSNAFDGSYNFQLMSKAKTKPISASTTKNGYCTFFIKEGLISIPSAKHCKLYGIPKKYYETFKGFVDKEGDIHVFFRISILKSQMDIRSVFLSGNLDKKKPLLKGSYNDISEIVIQVTSRKVNGIYKPW